MNFWEKYEATRLRTKSYVCVGLDSEYDKIPDFLKKEDDPILTFNKAIIDATQDITLCYKPNFAFYISRGMKGVQALIKTIEYIPDEIPIILDVKASSWLDSSKVYAKTYFDDFGVDSVTINPFAGEDVYNSFLDYKDKMLFLLVYTSNPSREMFFDYVDMWKNFGTDVGKNHQNLGAVVGPGTAYQSYFKRKRMKKNMMLIPGIGAQGGEKEGTIVEGRYTAEDPRIIINSSRSILFASKEKDFAEVARANCIKLKDDINHYLSIPKADPTVFENIY